MMKKYPMRYVSDGDYFVFMGTSKYIRTTTAKALLNKSVFTINTEQMCILTELGKTIEL
jgi:hypothetical protein